MFSKIRKPAATIAIVGLIVVGMGTSGAVAHSLITGHDIKNGTVTGADIRDGSLYFRDLSSGAVRKLTGQAGTVGATGATGAQGTAGKDGKNGTDGTNGTNGVKGDQGVQGLKGDPGVQGVQGLKGDQGLQGLQGLKGDQGVKGSPGLANLESDGPYPGATQLQQGANSTEAWTEAGNGVVQAGMNASWVMCPAGKVAIGGGWSRADEAVSAFRQLQIVTSQPTQIENGQVVYHPIAGDVDGSFVPNAWLVEGFYGTTDRVSGSVIVRPHVICAELAQ